MADNKIFAGPRIRRFRTGLGLTQTKMAESIGISASYLNLIERNQRPLTVQLLLKLAATHQINLEELQGEGDQELQGQIRELFSDPLLSTEVPDKSEMFELVDSTPNAAIAMVKLYNAYRESLERLSGLSQMMARGGDEAGHPLERLPSDEVRAKFQSQPLYIPAIERAADKILSEFEDQGDLDAQMREWLLKRHNVSVQLVPIDVMPNLRRRFDRHTNRLFISQRLAPTDQRLEIAMELALLSQRDLLDEETEFLNLSTDEAKRLARFELARLLGLAILLPYERFFQAARRARFDIGLLRARFDATFAQIVWRLLMLQKQGQAVPHFFAMEVDISGNQIRKGGARGFPSTHIGNCPKLLVHQAFLEPGKTYVERVITPSEQQFVVVARTTEGLRAGYDEKPQRTAILLGVPFEESDQIVYADHLQGETPGNIVEIGPSCRLCERSGCISRAQPPITRPLGLDDVAHGLSVFDFQ